MNFTPQPLPTFRARLIHEEIAYCESPEEREERESGMPAVCETPAFEEILAAEEILRDEVATWEVWEFTRYVPRA